MTRHESAHGKDDEVDVEWIPRPQAAARPISPHTARHDAGQRRNTTITSLWETRFAK